MSIFSKETKQEARERYSKNIISIELPEEINKEKEKREYSNGKARKYWIGQSRPTTAKSGIIHSTPRYLQNIQSLVKISRVENKRKGYSLLQSVTERIYHNSSSDRIENQNPRVNPKLSLFGRKIQFDCGKNSLFDKIRDRRSDLIESNQKNQERTSESIKKSGKNLKKTEKKIKNIRKDNFIFKISGKRLTQNKKLFTKLSTNP